MFCGAAGVIPRRVSIVIPLFLTTTGFVEGKNCGGGGSTQIGGTGAFIIGVFGRCGSEMDAMGLVLKP